jgi:ATP-dependent DNA helicase RecQ
MSERATVRADAEGVLRALAGPDAVLRPDQWTAIEALAIDRRRVLCVQRTGWGKSAVYFVATALLRAAQAGPTIIVSPLLALMRNQIAAAERAGIHARTINSANLEEWDGIAAEIRAGAVDVLLISPERLNNPDFRDSILPKLAADAGLVVVDEAHCISDWGHDFRPDYRRLRTLLAGLEPRTPVLATTATANARVVTDVADQLGTDSLVLRGPLARESLRLAVLAQPTTAHRLAWLADHLAALPGSGIIYTLTVAAAQETADFLARRGFAVAAYTGQSDDAARLAGERDLLTNQLKALVATSALGMGYDKPDLGFVIHLGSPPSPIAYYQQVGRAGRGVDSAEVLLLPGQEDEAIWRYFASLAFPPEDQVRAVLAALDPIRPMSTQVLEAVVDLRRSRLEMMLKVLDVDGAVHRVRGGWVGTGQPWAYDRQRHQRVAAARDEERTAMREYATAAGCRMEFLLRCLDDPAAAPCGRCDRCTGVPPDGDVSASALAAARAFLGQPGVEIGVKRLWPTGLAALGVPLKGKVDPAERAEPGRAIGRLTDLGWGNQLRALIEGDDAPLPPDVAAAVVAVLTDWAKGENRWADRPVAVLAIGSRRHPQLIDTTAGHISQVGRLRLLPAITARPGPAGAPKSNSPQRIRALYNVFALPAQVRDALADLDGPVLLVDDVVDSGWTMALVARLLRQAGAPAVLPFALAVTG